MQLRLFSSAAFLLLLLVPLSPAAEVRADNVAVEKALLRALISERNNRVARLAVEDATRGRLLTLGALSAADAVLSADALALSRTIAQLSPPPRAAVREQRPAPTTPALSLVAAPGVLWSPQARPVTAGLRSWPLVDATPQASTARSSQAVPWPFTAGSFTAGSFTDVAVSSPSSPAPSLSSAADGAPVADGGASDETLVSLPPSNVQTYGGLMVSGGSGAAFPLVAANGTVAAAALVPVATAAPNVPPRPQVSALALAEQRRRVVMAALVYVRSLEAWARGNAPTPTIVASDTIPSPEVLRQRLDRWSADPSLAGLSGATALSLSPRAAAETTLGAAVSISSPVTGAAAVLTGTLPAASTATSGATIADTAPVTDVQTSGVVVSGTLVGAGTVATATSLLLDTTLAGVLSDTVDAPVTVTSLAAITPAMGLTSTAPAAITSSSALSGEAVGAAQAAVTGTAIAPAAPVSASVPLSSGLALALAVEDNTPVMTVTAGLTSSTPLTLVVTLPVTAAQALAPPLFLSERGALESILRQGEAIFAALKASEPAVEQAYRTRLQAVAALNTTIQQRWYARYQAYVAYSTYPQRAAAWAAYARQLHQAGVAYAQWKVRMAAWTRYQQQLAAYRRAVSGGVTPVNPIYGAAPASGTAPAPGASLPPQPVAPPYPGPQPAPFTQVAPAWPGTPPPPALDPGPEPSGYPLPAAPDPIPSWDGTHLPTALVPLPAQSGSTPPPAILRAVGTAVGTGSIYAAGHMNTTQAALIAAGALDGVGSYQDPIKGVITTYFGGSDPYMSYHPAIDIAAPILTPIRATAAGVVTWAGYNVPGERHYGYGLCVMIQHNAHFSSVYAHMDDTTYGLQVHVGQVVQQGQIIGYEGVTGWTTGPHLHFEIREDNVQIDPLLLIPNPQD